MKIGVYPNPCCDPEFEAARRLVEAIRKHGAEPRIWREFAESFPGTGTFFDETIDAVISLGGDGTIISVFKYCAFHNVPLLGVNMGTMGFLTETALNGLDEVLGRLVSRKYEVRRRMLITGRQDGKAYVALNEVAVNKNSIGSALTIEVSINGDSLGPVKADGYMVSSPTGSTAYALSAGGPIVSPRAECMLLMPINAHSLSSRPIVVSADEKVVIQCGEGASLVVDGRVVAPAKRITVEKCKYDCPFVSMEGPAFYRKLKIKLVGIKEEI